MASEEGQATASGDVGMRGDVAVLGVEGMDAAEARRRVAQGGTILCLDVPPGTEVGIDAVAWRTGPKFMGIKMIPPGNHFFFYSARRGGGASSAAGDAAPRTGLFVRVAPGSVLVLGWNAKDEDFVHEAAMDADAVHRYHTGVRTYQFDRFLGPYPTAGGHAATWHALTSHLSSTVLDRVEPVGRAVVSTASRFVTDSDRTPAQYFEHGMTAARRRRLRAVVAHAEAQADADTLADGEGAPDWAAVTQSLLPHTAGLRVAGASLAAADVPSSSSASGAAGAEAVAGAGAGAEAGAGAGAGVRGGAGAGAGAGAGESKDEAKESAGDDVDMGGADSGKHVDAAGHSEGIGAGSTLFFTPIPGVGRGSKPADRTAHAIDTTACLQQLLFVGFKGRPELFIGEMQFAFVCFLMGQSLPAFEQWKRLVDVCCRAHDIVANSGAGREHVSLAPLLQAAFKAILAQLQHVPTDFFTSELSKDNFLRVCLREFVTTVVNNKPAEAVDAGLREAARQLQLLALRRFSWILTTKGVPGRPNGREEEDEDDDAPVIVDLDASMF